MQRKYIFVRKDKKCLKVLYNDIKYIEAVGRYVNMVTINEVHLLLLSIGQVEKQLPKDRFCRIHRSHIISLDYTSQFDNETIIVAGKEFPISRQYRHALNESTNVLCCDEKKTNEMKDFVVKKLARSTKLNEN